MQGKIKSNLLPSLSSFAASETPSLSTDGFNPTKALQPSRETSMQPTLDDFGSHCLATRVPLRVKDSEHEATIPRSEFTEQHVISPKCPRRTCTGPSIRLPLFLLAELEFPPGDVGVVGLLEGSSELVERGIDDRHVTGAQCPRAISKVFAPSAEIMTISPSQVIETIPVLRIPEAGNASACGNCHSSDPGVVDPLNIRIKFPPAAPVPGFPC
ncbi:GC-rich sequence DNA-binding factor-like protein [Striga asiatica]|uniref:GC-rich sequence DNA-binding factor-like protein n=1 Tax=Striga asiatica TaxID=4170 RepID=A0A5A7Q927_STRAF|nr:GC-rich sequence DNA-binding factor-like protein [Striga asiatica]